MSSAVKNKANPDKEYCIRTIVVGGEQCGKTALVERFSIEVFPIRPIKTVALTNYNKRIIKDDKIINLQITDTTGNKNSIDIVLNSLSNVKYVLVCHDLSDKKSWEDAKEWMRAIRAKADCKLVMCGTKSDLLEPDKRDARKTLVNYSEGLQIVNFQTSAKLGDNLVEMFDYVVEDYFAGLAKEEAAKSMQQIDDSPEKNPNSNRCCTVI